MASPVELIVGPARSGKAGYVLKAYLSALAAGGPGSCLMLVPTALRRRATESRLLAAQESGVLIRPQVLQMHELADRLLAAAGTPVRRIGELARRQVIRRCLAGLAAKEAAVLGPARDTPGLVDALDALFRELKAARVEPNVFGKALTPGLRTPRNRVLVRLYDAYQKALQQGEVYDDAGQFWHAAATVAEGQFGPFARLAVLAVDGFQDFAPAQLDMLEALSGRAERTLITLTWEPGRPNLFGVTGRTRERLRERFGPRLREIVVDEPSGLPADLERVRRGLFALPDASPPAAGGAIRIIRAAGRTREVEEVARRIADLVRAMQGGTAGLSGRVPGTTPRPDKPAVPPSMGQARATNSLPPPGSIAVIVRSIEPYAALVRQVFARHGLEFRVEAGRTLADCPIVRAAMALVRLQTEGYSFRALARLVKSNYFDPSAFGADAPTAHDTVRLAREANLWEGRERYAERFQYLLDLERRRSEATDDSGEPVVARERASGRLKAIEAAAGFVERLFDRLAMPEKASRGAMAARLRDIVRAAGLRAAAVADPSAERRARDIKALLGFEEVLDEVALLDEAEAGQVTLQEFLREVQQGLALASASAEEPADAPVVVLDARRARALSFDHVFLLGLAEKEFPRRGRRHPFFDDAERNDLRKGAVDLPDAGHDAEQEMLLAYLAMTRARQTLTVAYASLDAQGRPALPSHYLEELAGLFAAGKGSPPFETTEIGTRDLQVDAGRLRAPRDLLAKTMFELWGPGRTEHGDEHLAVLDEMLSRGPAAETALAGLAIEWEREHGEAFGPFDGHLAAPDILDDLCRRFPGQTTMSARRLEAFGSCPFAYFAGDILELAALEEPSPDLGPLDVGLIYHDLLERFFRALAASPAAGRLSEETRSAALALFEKTAADCFRQLEAGGHIGSPALWNVQKRNLLADVRRLLDWHVENLGAWRAAAVEVAFGAPPGSPVSPPGRRDPITVDRPHGPVRIRGRIDRIDLPADGAAGFQVIDYKTSSAPTAADMAEGTSFQLPIYLWAAQALLPEAARAGRAQAFFLPIRNPRRVGALASADAKGRPNEKFEPALARAAEYIRRFTDAMRLGLFPVLPRGRYGCPGHCDFQEICRVSQWRIRRKWQLHPLAPLELIEDKAAEDEEAAP
ncbi:MAG: PD-(D/E)XK nuclease family protein [Planctomycetes bacterium]|nr:PD-(D/E)XK nuclease family protein [Planctomycetota bacterium]